jgi:hypothetical protein
MDTTWKTKTQIPQSNIFSGILLWNSSMRERVHHSELPLSCHTSFCRSSTILYNLESNKDYTVRVF